MDEDSFVLSRRSGESALEHHKRIIYGKLVDKTLSDYDYSELAKYVYGKDYSTDCARRMMYGSRNTLELLEREKVDISDSSIVDDYEERMRNFKKEKQRFFDQRREYNKLIAADARKEHLYDTLERAARELYETVGDIYSGWGYGLYEPSDSEAVLVFSDWHYGAVTNNVFNKFNIDICLKRIKNTVEAAARRITLHKCSKLHIVVLGDLFHGAIHNSVRVASEELVCDQIMQVAEILAQSISYLGSFVPSTKVYMTYGNHGRTVQNKSDSVHNDNLERLIPWWLTQRLSSEVSDIEVMPDNNLEFLFINAAGHEVCATHGDLDGVKSSPRLLSALFSKQYGKDIEYVLLGDKHHRESFEELGVTAMLCGALCGSDNYANDKRLYSTPSQMLLIFNKDDGLDAEYRIKCDVTHEDE